MAVFTHGDTAMPPFQFDDPFALPSSRASNPFAVSNHFTFGSTRAASAFPDPTFPAGESESSFLGNLMEGGLGGLAYVGKLLDKTFGGRAVRGGLGALTGVPGSDPWELLSVLPFSDTLGITDERHVTHGEDLLRGWGVTDPADDSFMGSVLPGVATEIALDPAMWVGAGVPRAVFGTLGKIGRGAGRGVGAATGFDPVARASSFATDTLLPPLRAAFDNTVHGSTLGSVQRGVAPTFDSTLNTLTDAANAAYYDTTVRLAPFAKAFPGAQDVINRAGTQAIELGAGPAAQTLAAGGFGPGQIDEIIDLARTYGARGQGTRGNELAAGLGSAELLDLPRWQIEANERLAAFNRTPGAGGVLAPGHAADLPIWQHELMQARRGAGLTDEFTPAAEYLPASLNPYPGSEGWSRVPRRELGSSSPFEIARDDFQRGLPGGRTQLNDLAADPRLSGIGRTLPEDDVVRVLAEQLGGGVPLGQIPLNSGVYDQARQLSRFLENLRPEAQQGLYNLDWAGNINARELDSARRIASARSVMETARPASAAGGFIRPVADFQAAGATTPYVRVNEFLDRMGMTATDAATGNPQAKEQVARLLGIDTTARDWQRTLDGFAIPADVARDVARMGQAWQVPEALAPIVGAWDAVTNLFKAGITAPFPAFHGRNLMSGIFNMWRDGVGMGDVIGTGGEMLRLQRGGTLSAETAARLYPGRNLTPEAASQELLKELMANRVAFTRNTQVADAVGGPAVKWGVLAEDIPTVGGAVRPFGDDAAAFGNMLTGRAAGGTNWNPLNIAGVGNRTEDTFAPVAAGRALGNTVEDWLRGTHFLTKRLGGATTADAKLAVLKYQLDYSAMSEFERNVMKRLFPFYAFSRRNLPPLLEDLATKPAKLAASARVATGSREEGEFVPPWIAEGSSVRIPGGDAGKDRFISSFGLPFEDEGIKALGALAQGDIRRVFQQGFGMAQPLFKLPAEVATGTQMYSGRPLSSLQPYEFTTLGGAVPDDYARVMSQTLSNTPFSRAASTLNRFTDSRENVGTDILSLLIGSRVTDVDTDKAREQAALQLLRNQLRGEPGVRTSENMYVRPEDLPKMRPEDVTLYGLLRELQSRGAERARAARGQ